MRTATDLKSRAISYVEAAGGKDADTLEKLLADDVMFIGPFTKTTGAADYMNALQRMAPIWDRSDVREAFTSGSKACVAYDFITKAQTALTCVEVLTFEEERITHIELFFDPAAFAQAAKAAGAT